MQSIFGTFSSKMTEIKEETFQSKTKTFPHEADTLKNGNLQR